MEKLFFDIIEHGKTGKQVVISEYVTFEQAADIVGKCYPEHTGKMRKTVSKPYVVITSEK